MISLLAPETTMICQHCGAGIPDDSNFCTYCGAPLVSESPNLLAGTPHTPVFSVPYRYKLSLNKLLGDTIELYKRNFGTMCLVGLIVIIVTFATLPFSYATGFLQWVARAEGNHVLLIMAVAGDICVSLLGTILQWYIILGAFRQCLYLARGGIGLQARLIFPPFMLFLKFIGLMLVLACIHIGILLLCGLPAGIMFLVAYLGGAFADNNFPAGILIPLIGIGSVFVIAGCCLTIWVSMRLCLAQMFIADRDAGIVDSIRDAWQVSSGNFWRLLLAMIVLGVGAMLGCLLCGVGIILTIAFSYLGIVLVYLQLTGQPNCLDYPPPQY